MKTTEAPPDLQGLINRVIKEAGAITRDFMGKKVEQWDKGDDDPVTEADIAVDNFLRQELTSAHPGYGWLSEETADNTDRLSKDRVWIVDPIDGTRAFLKGRPHFTICVALVENGRPINAAIYNPMSDELFEATAGRGAKLNDKKISVSAREEIEGCRMLAYGPMFKHPAWPEPWPEMHLENPNSVALRIALVANGSFDAMMALNWKSEWDIAAADLIVHEAGGLATKHTGERFTYNQSEATQHRSIVAAGPEMHQALMKRISHLKLP